MISPAIPGGCRPGRHRSHGVSAGPLSVRSFGFATGGDDASREDRDAPSARCASFEDGGVAINEIARRVGVASSTVRLTLKRLAAAGLGWPFPDARLRGGPRTH